MFHYNGRPISRQEMTEMLADRHAAVELAKKQRQREKDAEAVRSARRGAILDGLVWLMIVLVVTATVFEVLK